uniref:Uncharacterized protein n=1 Tax=Vespula pensylvanica TaxID=30213 RepID=A0A834NZA7_VESPE|nr:hypothetical protein H0235_009820 [Vespula pensylvanica]
MTTGRVRATENQLSRGTMRLVWHSNSPSEYISSCYREQQHRRRKSEVERTRKKGLGLPSDVELLNPRFHLMVDIRSNSNEPTPSAGSNNFHRQSYPKFRNWLGLILAGEPSDTGQLKIYL